MSTALQAITSATYYISAYGGFFNVIIGLVGNLINFLVFTQFKLFRGNQPAFFLAVGSVVDCGQLIIAIGTRAVSAAFSFDPTQTSVVWCKLRAYLSQLGLMSSTSIVCFAAVCQYLSTSHHNRLRQISTLKLAEQLVIILFSLAIPYNVLFLIFQELRVMGGCSTFNVGFNYFYSYVHYTVIVGLLPIVVSFCFSSLAYRNVRRIVRRQIALVRRRLDHQLTAIILVRVALFLIVYTPFVIFRIYQLNENIDLSNTLALATDQLIRISLSTIFNLYFSGSFYVFIITSPRYRRQVKYLFEKVLWRKYLLMKTNRNRIEPDNALQDVESHGSSLTNN